MEKIMNLWEKSGREKNLKVRFVDWNHQIRFFIIEDFCRKTNKLKGTLDTGEKITYPDDSLHWKLYEDGDELVAKAV